MTFDFLWFGFQHLQKDLFSQLLPWHLLKTHHLNLNLTIGSSNIIFLQDFGEIDDIIKDLFLTSSRNVIIISSR